MKLSQDIIKALEGNRWVERLTESQIIYTSKFKIEAVEEYLRGISADKIFRNAGVPLELLKKDYALNCLKQWVAKYKERGLEALKEDRRGTANGPTKGRPKKTNLDDLTYEELKAVVQIQTEVIEALKKKRALAQKK